MKKQIKYRVIRPYGFHRKGDIVTPISAMLRDQLLAQKLVEIVRDDEDVEHAVPTVRTEKAVRKRGRPRKKKVS